VSARPLTRPFDFTIWLKPPPRRWFFVAWLNVTLVVALVGMSSSRLVFAPGIEVDLPASAEVDRMAVSNSLVATVTAGEVVYFSGRRLGLSEFGPQLAREIAGRKDVVLLVRADASVRMGALLEVVSSARKVGVARVQLAAEREAETQVPTR
jgi:biopolymer transport protein ExbD